MTFNKILSVCRNLRRAFEQDEAKFFLGLVSIEAEHLGVIRDAGHDSYTQFLKRNELCDPTRYSSFKAGLAYTDVDTALRLGAGAVMELAQVREKRNVRKYETAVSAWVDEHGGIAPSRETARRILRQVDPREEIPRVVSSISMVAKLRAENQQLRAELSAAHKKIRELEKDLDKRQKRAS